jgi:membrane-bound ClpP family serine protease
MTTPRHSWPVARILGTFGLVALGGYAAYLAGTALATGTFPAGVVYASARDPVMYWVHTLGSGLFAAGVGWLVIANVLQGAGSPPTSVKTRRGDLKLVIDNPDRPASPRRSPPRNGADSDDEARDRKNKPTLH